MKNEATKREYLTCWQKLQVFLISHAASLLLGIIGSTLRYRVEDWDNFQQFENQKRPIIYSFWHNQILYATHFWRFRSIVVMTSRHFDGENIARVIESFGYGTARGSSGRGGLRALIELKRHLGAGTDVAFTVDGPKGPVYQVKAGPLWLSRQTSAPIVPFHIEPKRFWRLKSWDRFRIPKPFSPLLVKIGRPLIVPSKGPKESWMHIYQEEMDRLKNYCEAYWDSPQAGRRAAGLESCELPNSSTTHPSS